jgi:hypothetical protein
LVVAGGVVVVTPDVTVLRRVVVVLAAVGAGVATAATVPVVGFSGAFTFWTCVAANALMPVKDDTVIAVAAARRTSVERTSGAVFPGERVMSDSRPSRRGRVMRLG